MTKLQALSLANEYYKHKMGLITNGVIIDVALKFVERNKNQQYDNKEGNNQKVIVETVDTF